MKTAKEIIIEYASYYGNFGRLPIYLGRLSGMEPIQVDHSTDIEVSALFCEIDKAIEYLNDLKKQGFQRIDQCWSGYEDNYFVASKRELETESEFVHRVECALQKVDIELDDKEERERIRKKRIAELQEELSSLKKGVKQ